MKILQWMLAQAEFDPAEITTKHLQGRHDQKRHGRRFGNEATPAQIAARVRSAAGRERQRVQPHPSQPSKSKTLPRAGWTPSDLYMFEFERRDSGDLAKTMGITGVRDANGLADAVRDIFEVNDPISGIKSRVLFVKSVRDSIAVEGKFYDRNGKEIGHFERTFEKDRNKKLSVGHDLFMLDKEFEGTGFGSRFVRHCQEKYMQYGFKNIVLYANIDVGGYAWARMGFDFKNSFDVNTMYNFVKSSWDERYPKNAMPSRSNFSHSWEFAALTGPDGFKIGKSVMLGSSWIGIKNLDPNDLGFKVGEAYFDGK